MKILVIKLAALGDVVLAFSAMKRIRIAHPDAEITLLTTPPYAGLAEASGLFDHVQTDGRPRKVRDLVVMLARLRRSRFDLVYDLQTSSRSSRYFHALWPRLPRWSGIARGCWIAPAGRTGYLIRQHLDDAFAKNHDTAPAYRMNLSLGEARYPRGVRIDSVATRYEYVLTATYVLTRVPAGTQAKRGSVRVELTYDSADQPYASITAQQDAQDRAAEEAARRIQLELAVWLANGKS